MSKKVQKLWFPSDEEKWDEVRFYNRELKKADVVMLFNQQTASTSNFLGPNINLCQAQATTLTANVPGYSTYIWSNGSTSPSITVFITVTLFASNDCGDDTVSNTISYACDAIEEYTRQIQLNVLPQPISEGEINAAFSLSKAQNYYIVLTNVMGQEVIRTHSERATGEVQAAVSIDALPAGIYSFAIFTEEGVAVRKITIE